MLNHHPESKWRHTGAPTQLRSSPPLGFKSTLIAIDEIRTFSILISTYDQKDPPPCCLRGVHRAPGDFASARQGRGGGPQVLRPNGRSPRSSSLAGTIVDPPCGDWCSTSSKNFSCHMAGSRYGRWSIVTGMMFTLPLSEAAGGRRPWRQPGPDKRGGGPDAPGARHSGRQERVVVSVRGRELPPPFSVFLLLGPLFPQISPPPFPWTWTSCFGPGGEAFKKCRECIEQKWSKNYTNRRSKQGRTS